jgi:hypothetical protein
LTWSLAAGSAQMLPWSTKYGCLVRLMVSDTSGPGEDKVFGCGVPGLCDGQRMRPEKLEAWQALRERYGDRDESRVDGGNLVAPAT